MKAARERVTEVRQRVNEVLQRAVPDPSLEIEFTIKEKNRRLLALEEERRSLNEEVAGRDGIIQQQRQQLEREAKAMQLMKDGARA